jgi:hypothetical protein
MKKIFICFIVSALMSLVFTGCSSDKPEQAGQDMKSATSQAQEAEQSSVSVKNKDGSVTVENGTGSMSVATDKSVELPKGYPKDKFPIYEGSFIYTAIEQSGSYAITAYSKDDVKKVVVFIKKFWRGRRSTWTLKPMKALLQWERKAGTPTPWT